MHSAFLTIRDLSVEKVNVDGILADFSNRLEKVCEEKSLPMPEITKTRIPTVFLLTGVDDSLSLERLFKGEKLFSVKKSLTFTYDV
jgi:hypothetical protein